MTSDELRAFLTQRGVKHEERRMDHGVQFRCASGEIFNVFDTGRTSYQGKATSKLSRDVQAWERETNQTDTDPAEGEVEVRSAGIDNRVFIVYGHDQTARDSLELVLRRMGMEPIVLANLPAGGDTIIEKLERFLGRDGLVGFAIVLLTPDDEGNVVARPEGPEVSSSSERGARTRDGFDPPWPIARGDSAQGVGGAPKRH